MCFVMGCFLVNFYLMNRTFVVLVSFLVFFLLSCTKEAGEGGNSSVHGKIIAWNYNSEFTELKGIYPAADEDVYIIYGNDLSFGDRTKSSYDGVYEFKYLRPGEYTVYVYSKDSSLSLPSETFAVVKKVSIGKTKESVEVEDIKIYK